MAIGVLAGALAITAPAAQSSTRQSPAALLDHLDSVWTKGDIAGYSTVYGPGAVVSLFTSSKLVGRTHITDEMSSFHTCKYRLKRIAPITVHGSYAVTFKTANSCDSSPVTFLAVYQIEHGRVVRDWHMLPGETPPLDEAAPS